MRIIKFVTGILLLPCCVAITRTLAAIVHSLGPSSYRHLPLSFWGLAAGFLLWTFLYLVLPRPMRAYVLAHELTHALWATMMGGRASRLRVSRSSGSVKVTRGGFLVTLAPYFFPLYTVAVISGYYVASLFFDQATYEPLWLGLIGLTWAFHLTFTLTTLRQHQPDIREHGRLFSYAVIYFLNALGIGIWIVMVASPGLEGLVRQFANDMRFVWAGCAAGALRGWRTLARRVS